MVFTVITNFVALGKNSLYVIRIFGNPATGKEKSSGNILSFENVEEGGSVFITPRKYLLDGTENKSVLGERRW